MIFYAHAAVSQIVFKSFLKDLNNLTCSFLLLAASWDQMAVDNHERLVIKLEPQADGPLVSGWAHRSQLNFANLNWLGLESWWKLSLNEDSKINAHHALVDVNKLLVEKLFIRQLKSLLLDVVYVHLVKAVCQKLPPLIYPFRVFFQTILCIQCYDLLQSNYVDIRLKVRIGFEKREQLVRGFGQLRPAVKSSYMDIKHLTTLGL